MRSAFFLLLALTAGCGDPDAPPYRRVELAPSQPRAGELRVRWFGVTSLLFEDGRNAVMIDGFFSRPSWRQLRSGTIAPDEARIADGLKRAGARRIDAVLTAPSHHDHAMDSALVARLSGALLIGSASTANIGRGAGLPEARIKTVEGGEAYCFGDFRVAIIASRHAFPNAMPGRIRTPLKPPARVTSYREGGSFAFLIEHRGRSILVHPSASYRRGEMRGMAADTVFLGIGGLGRRGAGYTNRMWNEVVAATGARLVVPIHWDDFTLPLEQGLKPGNGFETAMTRLEGLARKEQRAVLFMPLFEPVALPSAVSGPGSPPPARAPCRLGSG